MRDGVLVGLHRADRGNLLALLLMSSRTPARSWPWTTPSRPRLLAEGCRRRKSSGCHHLMTNNKDAPTHETRRDGQCAGRGGPLNLHVPSSLLRSLASHRLAPMGSNVLRSSSSQSQDYWLLIARNRNVANEKRSRCSCATRLNAENEVGVGMVQIFASIAHLHDSNSIRDGIQRNDKYDFSYPTLRGEL